jgi:hypothetical protein
MEDGRCRPFSRRPAVVLLSQVVDFDEGDADAPFLPVTMALNCPGGASDVKIADSFRLDGARPFAVSSAAALDRCQSSFGP